MVKLILKQLGKPESLITYVTDRPGHDLRYAIDSSKVERLYDTLFFVVINLLKLTFLCNHVISTQINGGFHFRKKQCLELQRHNS